MFTAFRINVAGLVNFKLPFIKLTKEKKCKIQ